MPYIEGANRKQINFFPYTLDDYVSEDNPVRVIDAYVDSLNLEELGFEVFSAQDAGQKPYRREDLLKLYIYCYLNRIRSSRAMEAEATRNTEVMWLIGRITPDHGTLSAFMKNNKKAIKQLFKEFTLMLKQTSNLPLFFIDFASGSVKQTCFFPCSLRSFLRVFNCSILAL